MRERAELSCFEWCEICRHKKKKRKKCKRDLSGDVIIHMQLFASGKQRRVADDVEMDVPSTFGLTHKCAQRSIVLMVSAGTAKLHTRKDES